MLLLFITKSVIVSNSEKRKAGNIDKPIALLYNEHIMKMNQEDLRLLSAAVRDAGEDLFCVTGALPPYETLSDVFLCRDENTLLLLPGPFSLPDANGGTPPAVSFEAKERFGYSVCYPTAFSRRTSGC